MEMALTILRFFILPIVNIVAYPNGAPCSVQHTMRPSVEKHGLPQRTNPPYYFAIFNSDGEPAQFYDDQLYTVRLSGTTYFRSFLIQARLATKQGSVIGHLKAGEFIKNDTWSTYEIQFQNCPSLKNSSITNTNDSKKYSVEALWKTNYNVGPVQFVITVFKDQMEYWPYWMPKSGLLYPKQNALFKNRLFSSGSALMSSQRQLMPKKSTTVALSTLQTVNATDFEIELNSALPTPAFDLRKNYCRGNPCKNGGKCLNTYTYDRFQCTCPSNWTGTRCEKKNFCREHRCKFGVCLNNEYDYICDCDPGYGGQFCEHECPLDFCNNGGACVIVDGKRRCKCSNGYVGNTCQIRIDRCQPNPCLNGAACKNDRNSFVCLCPPGYMGKLCHRPCQDVYGSCEDWGEKNKCVLMKHATDFYDVNCAVTCGQCKFVNSTVKTFDPLPPLLEPFLWILGKWRVDYGQNMSFPVNMANARHGYTEELTVSNQRVLQFGLPYLNFSVKAVSRSDKSNQHISVGFLTLKPASDPTEVALMSTSNQGITTIEEGHMEEESIDLKMNYAIAVKRWQQYPSEAKRTFKLNGQYLQETVQIHRYDGSLDYYTKYFVKVESFEI